MMGDKHKTFPSTEETVAIFITGKISTDSLKHFTTSAKQYTTAYFAQISNNTYKAIAMTLGNKILESLDWEKVLVMVGDMELENIKEFQDGIATKYAEEE